MNEEERYAAVQAQIAEINTTAATNPNPVKSLLSAMLTAEMYTHNERVHNRWLARRDLMQALQARVRNLRGEERDRGL